LGSGASSTTSASLTAGPDASGSEPPSARDSISVSAPLSAWSWVSCNGVMVFPSAETRPTFRSPLLVKVAIRMKVCSCVLARRQL